VGLVAASAIQVAVGLDPLSRLGRALVGVRAGAARRLVGSFPQEVAALVDELNLLLGQQERSLERARGQAADLAHALKTSLQLLLVEADRLQPGDHGHAVTIREQAARMRAVIDRHLARARLQGLTMASGPGVEVQACAMALLRVLGPQASAREVTMDCVVPPGERYAGDRADLEEILGNLLDNACKWACSRVRLSGSVEQGMLRLVVEDDGPGLDEADRERAFARGRRLDETVAGSGLGLALARDIAEACGGWITLSRAPIGGLAAAVFLPRP
jgi:signal transduction histidine kinase